MMADTRQRIWDVLMFAHEPLSLSDIRGQADCASEPAERYLSAMKKAEYVSHERGSWALVKKTGPIALKINSRGHYRDFNLDPPVLGEAIKQYRELRGLSLSQFGLMVYGYSGVSTRLREMENGTRPVSQRVEEFYKNAPPDEVDEAYGEMKEREMDKERILDDVEEDMRIKFQDELIRRSHDE